MKAEDNALEELQALGRWATRPFRLVGDIASPAADPPASLGFLREALRSRRNPGMGVWYSPSSPSQNPSAS